MSAFPGEFNRSTQHYSLERSGDVCHPLAALPALSGLCLQLRRETTSVHAPPYAYRSNVPDRVEGCCVDRLNPPPESGHSLRQSGCPLWANMRPTALQQTTQPLLQV